MALGHSSNSNDDEMMVKMRKISFDEMMDEARMMKYD